MKGAFAGLFGKCSFHYVEKRMTIVSLVHDIEHLSP